MKRFRFSSLCLTFTLLLIAVLQAQLQTETLLYDFTGGNDGGNPYAAPILDGHGNLYGTTVYGGTYGYGAVFELSPAPNGQWTETVLHSFNLDGQDGLRPYSSLVMDSAGNLYGTTYLGGIYGTYGLGTVYELMPGKGVWTEKVLHSFNSDGIDGFNPYGNLVFDTKGNLYGTTYDGGTVGSGTVFELSPDPDGTWQENIIFSFDYTHGGAPYGGVGFDRAGHLYGTTQYGGDFTHGTVFELVRQPNGTWEETVLHSFDPTADAFNPMAGLVIDKSGRLYGTGLYGGNDWPLGAVFEMQLVNGQWHESVIHSFEATNDGQSPYGPLALDLQGRLYGTTYVSYVNGVYGGGIVFQLTRKSNVWQETILYQLDTNAGDGGNPYSGVVLDSAGNIYGTTYGGGNHGAGVVFEVIPPTATTSTLTASPNPSTYGQAVTFSAVVTPTPPNGETVSFMKGKTVLGTGTLSRGSARSEEDTSEL